MPGIRLYLVATACAGLALLAATASAQGGRDAVLVDPAASQLCVDTINRFRATLKLPPVARWVEGESMAATEALEDSRSGVNHGAIAAYFKTQQGHLTSISQNECPGWPGPASRVASECTAGMWSEGPGSDYKKHGHYINLSNPYSTQAACGFATAADGSIWMAENLRPSSADAVELAPDQAAGALTDNTTPQQAAQFCLDTINGYRKTLKLPPYPRWAQGEQCAARQAAAYASGQPPDLDQDPCLANEAYGQSVCGQGSGSLDDAVSNCLQSGWNEGPGADFSSHGDYLNMASRQYRSAACGVVRGADGAVRVVQIYK